MQQNNSPLMDAIFNEPLEIVQLLLEHKADVNTKMRNGLTSLMIATKRQDRDQARLLLQYGANVNARTQDGGTALIFAVTNKDVELCQMLIKHHADVTVTYRGKTALVLAKAYKNRQLVQILQQAGAK